MRRSGLAGVEGLELSTSGFGDRRSSQLSYTPARPEGAGPVSRARALRCQALPRMQRPPRCLHGCTPEARFESGADVAQLVELQISNLNVASSNLVVRSTSPRRHRLVIDSPAPPPLTRPRRGGVPEWPIGAVSKTVVRASVPWVRIPPPPPQTPLNFSHCSIGFESDDLGPLSVPTSFCRCFCVLLRSKFTRLPSEQSHLAAAANRSARWGRQSMGNHDAVSRWRPRSSGCSARWVGLNVR